MKEAIIELLKSEAPKETFCTSLQAPAGDLSLEVKGVGPIKYPVTQKTAKALIEQARLAPFGWREKTVIDTRVRNVWEVPKSKIKIPKRDFSGLMNPVLDKIKQGLGLMPEGELSAELHNLLIYEKGQFFSSHQDSEKANGMIGTMVVLLPSSYRGGALVIDQQGDKKLFRAPQKFKSQLHIFAFYADCHHEVKKVSSGYRVALTFNLFFKAPRKVNSHSHNPQLTSHIRKYFSVPSDLETPSYHRPHPQWFVYLLDHQYSQKGLNWSHLKGADRIRADQLCAVSDELGLETHLALAEVHQLWQAEPEYDNDWRYKNDWHYEEDDSEDNEGDYELNELVDEDYTLTHWINRQGKAIKLGEHSVPERMFCWTKANDDMKPFKSEYEGYMGNYGNTLDRWYHRAAVVLWSREQKSLSEFVINSNKALKNIKQVLKKDRKQGIQLLKQVLPYWKYHFDQSANLLTLLEVATMVNDKALALELLSDFSLEVINKKTYRGLEMLFETYGEEWTLRWLERCSKTKKYETVILRDLSYLAINLFKKHNTILSWLFEYQLKTLITEDKKRNSTISRVDLNREQKEILTLTADLFQALTHAKAEKLLKKFISHILSHQRIYSNLMLARIVINQKSKLSSELAWKNLISQTISRIESELSKVREKGDWSILEPVPCKCADCKVLVKFLLGKGQKELSWPLAKKRRQHIHHIIDGMAIGLTHKTQRTGSPHKLILEKTSAYFKREAAEKAELQKCLEGLN